MSCGEKPPVFLEVEKLIGLSKRSTEECAFASMTRSQRHRSLQSANIWAFSLPTPDPIQRAQTKATVARLNGPCYRGPKLGAPQGSIAQGDTLDNTLTFDQLL
jgi:hypothetical protein